MPSCIYCHPRGGACTWTRIWEEGRVAAWVSLGGLVHLRGRDAEPRFLKSLGSKNLGGLRPAFHTTKALNNLLSHCTKSIARAAQLHASIFASVRQDCRSCQ